MDEIIQTFNNTFKEFLLELNKAFPEEVSNNIIDNYNPDKESALKTVSQITETFAGLSTRISEEDDNIFFEKSIILLSDLDLSLIFKNASKSNKNVIWKYIQTLFLMSTAIETKKTSVDDMVGVFKESLPENDVKEMKEGINQILNKLTKTVSENKENDHVNIEDTYKGMFAGTQIGQLAEEIAQGINLEEFTKGMEQNLSSDSMNPPNINDVLKMFSEDNGLLNVMNTVSDTLKTKMESGELNQEKMLSEVNQIFSKIQSEPMMKDIFQSKDIKNMFANCANPNMNSKSGMPPGMPPGFGPVLQNMFGNATNKPENEDFDVLEEMFSDLKNSKGGITQENIKKAAQVISNEQPKKTVLTQKEKKDRLRAKLKEKIKRRNKQN
jgi:hypothetical protein